MEGLFLAPRPVSIAPLTTSQPQLNLAEQGIRKDATYSLRTKKERSAPSCEENSIEHQVNQISHPMLRHHLPLQTGPRRRRQHQSLQGAQAKRVE